MLYKKLESKIKQKYGSIMLMFSMLLVFVLLPLFGVLVDYNNIRMYAMDLKYMQDVAGIACISTGSSELGGQFTGKCNEAIKKVFVEKMTPKRPYLSRKGDVSYGVHDVANLRVEGHGKDQFKICFGNNGGKRAALYKPIILHPRLLKFLGAKNTKDGDVEINVECTHFSATYKMP